MKANPQGLALVLAVASAAELQSQILTDSSDLPGGSAIGLILEAGPEAAIPVQHLFSVHPGLVQGKGVEGSLSELVNGEWSAPAVPSFAADLAAWEHGVSPTLRPTEDALVAPYDSIESLAADPVRKPLAAASLPALPQQATGLIGILACLFFLFSRHRILA